MYRAYFATCHLNGINPYDWLRYVLENKRVFVLKNELNTRPRFYYFYGV